MFPKIRVYHVLDPDADVQERNRLIDIKYINHPMEGWQIFRVKRAFGKNSSPLKRNSCHSSLGKANPAFLKHFMVTAINNIGQPVRFQVRRRSDQLTNYQPVLVVFNGNNSAFETKKQTSLQKHNISLPQNQNPRSSNGKNLQFAFQFFYIEQFFKELLCLIFRE